MKGFTLFLLAAVGGGALITASGTASGTPTRELSIDLHLQPYFIEGDLMAPEELESEIKTYHKHRVPTHPVPNTGRLNRRNPNKFAGKHSSSMSGLTKAQKEYMERSIHLHQSQLRLVRRNHHAPDTSAYHEQEGKERFKKVDEAKIRLNQAQASLPRHKAEFKSAKERKEKADREHGSNHFMDKRYSKVQNEQVDADFALVRAHKQLKDTKHAIETLPGEIIDHTAMGAWHVSMAARLKEEEQAQQQNQQQHGDHNG